MLAYVFQERMIFLPETLPLSHQYDFCQPYEEFFITAEDGAQLNVVYLQQEKAKGAILYFHGNSGNISNLVHVANMIYGKGYDVYLFDYRSYGKSTGKISEGALKGDAQLLYELALRKYEENKIIIYGRSLGTGIASGLAAANHPQKLILESPFYSGVEIGKYRFPFLPVQWISRYKFPTNQYVQTINCPIFIFHGTEDSVIPFEQAQKLYDAIPGKSKKLFTIEGGDHKYLYGFDAFGQGLSKVLD
jgi:alpha-beta hydrolase superfamily lysophospholipase